MDLMVETLCKELLMQSDYLGKEVVHSVYFGGGTPSLLNHEQLKKIMRIIQLEYDLSSNPEITLEANPDDLNAEKLGSFKNLGINRLSIGIQSFHDKNLSWMNRQHTGQEAIDSFFLARQAGFENISIDLIYAVPAENHDLWEADLKQAMLLHPEHISSYCLTIEPKTAFGKWLERGKLEVADEDFAAEQFEMLIDYLRPYGYEAYEISNFCQPGYESKHNSNYWRHEKYLGIGPSAHSFNGKIRQYNVANNGQYLRSIADDVIPAEVVWLSEEDQINEYILTSLRTKWGCNLEYLKENFDVNLLVEHRDYLNRLSLQDYLYQEGHHLILTDSGKLLADKIASDLFVRSEE